MLGERSLEGTPPQSRASEDDSFPQRFLSAANLDRVRGLSDLAQARGQTLPQMAIAWLLRDERFTSALGAVSSVAHLAPNLTPLHNLPFSSTQFHPTAPPPPPPAIYLP